MHRTTMMLPSSLKERATRRAAERGISLGELIRQSLERELSTPEPRRAWDSFFDDQAVWTGEVPADGAIAHDKYLYDDEP